MAWILITVTIIVIWVAYLIKNSIYSSWASSNSEFLRKNGQSFQKRNALLVIAHPDDESMFFSPTISYLTSTGHNPHILCMSTGNANGLGEFRKEELYRASVILKVPVKQVKILDRPEFQDGFGELWDSDLLAKIVEEQIISCGIDTVITFDSYGVSGHCNHRDVHHGVRRLLNTLQRDIEAWELVSTNIIRKYSGFIDMWYSMSRTKHCTSGEMYCLLNKDPSKSFLAMAQHTSQWVWFRKLFVACSSYTYVNTIKCYVHYYVSGYYLVVVGLWQVNC